VIKIHSLRYRIAIVALFVAFANSVKAYDFSSQSNGKTIFYNIISSSEVEVTDSGYYSGKIILPQEVEFNGKTYIVTKIADNAFYDCERLLSISMPSAIKYIGKNAFAGCRALKDITIPLSVKEIRPFAFSECSSLETVNYEAIHCSLCAGAEGGVFAYCLNVNTIYIGKQVEFIPDYAFNGCKNVQLVVSRAKVPPMISHATFNDINHSIPIIVPCYYSDNLSYTDADFWKDFADIAPQEKHQKVNVSYAICQGETLLFGDSILSDAGVYEQTFANENGCDSIVVLRLVINQPKETSIFDTICQGETYLKNGFNQMEQGTFVQKYQTNKGCDSTVTLYLTKITLHQPLDVNVQQIDNTLALRWQSMDTDLSAVSYELYRNGELITTTKQNYYIDADLLADKTYSYELREIKGRCSSIFSQPQSCYYSLQDKIISNVSQIIVYDAMQREIKNDKMFIPLLNINSYKQELPKGVYCIKVITTDIKQLRQRIVVQ
jgi:hypothetical protein